MRLAEVLRPTAFCLPARRCGTMPAWTSKRSRSCALRTPPPRWPGTSAWGSLRSGSIASNQTGPRSSIARGRARLFLSEHRGDARPDTLVGLFVSDIAPVLAEFGPPAGEQPYRCEIELRDPDSNRLRISTARG